MQANYLVIDSNVFQVIVTVSSIHVCIEIPLLSRVCIQYHFQHRVAQYWQMGGIPENRGECPIPQAWTIGHLYTHVQPM